MAKKFVVLCFFGILALAIGYVPALAEEVGRAVPWQLGFQHPESPIMETLFSFHNFLLAIIAATTVFVLVLLVYTCIRFRAKANPVPSKRAHNTFLEIIWTLIPVLILGVIAFKSVPMIYYFEKVENADMTLKVTGFQWYWGYTYPDQDNLSFESNIVPDKELKPGDPRLLTVDNPLVLPVDTTIRVQVTAADVIHNWAIPSLGVKIDATPGRLNETWVKIKKPGMYYGQCSELCGKGHGFMPIVIHAVSKEAFGQWVAEAKQKFASTGTGVSVALHTQ